MGKRAPLNIHLDQSSTEAKYVRDINGEWEYGVCQREKSQMVYKKKGVKITMSAAETANGMGRPLPRSTTSLNTVRIGQFYSANHLRRVSEAEREN